MKHFSQWFRSLFVEPDEDAAHHAEERIYLKVIDMTEENARLREALKTLVAMHRGPPDAVGNWEWALDKADAALALGKRPEEYRNDPRLTRQP